MKLEAGFYPFWFWNDELNKKEIKFQIKEMADKGIKGFFIHPRQGLKQPYLSETFFEMVDETIATAKKHNLYVHLYDEYPYPSGIAGGEVIMENPEYSATRLIQKTEIVEGGKIYLKLPFGKILSVKGYPLNNKDEVVWDKEIDLKNYTGMVLTEDSYNETGLTTYNQKRYFASNPHPVIKIDLPPGKYKIFASIETIVEDFKYWGSYVDVLNPEAIRNFLRKTHKRYAKRYKNEFGNIIPSIFTDEITPTWSKRIPGAFKKEYGYDLCNYLPALQDRSHPDHRQVAFDLYKLKFKMFCNSFEKPVKNWCQKNNLLYAGEKPAMRLSQLKYMDIPGCDPGHVKAGNDLDILEGRIRGNAKSVASAAYFYEKEGSMVECYHSIGWSGTLQDAKLIAEGLLLLGIDYLVPHGFFYTTHGLKKHDAPPSFFYQMPYWPLFGELSQRIDKIKDYFKDTYIETSVLLLDPHSGLPEKEDIKAYEKILKILMANKIGFKITDTDILQNGEIKEGILEIKDHKIKLIIIPPMPVIEEPLKKWLDKFEKSGGKVIYGKRKIQQNNFKDKILKQVSPDLIIKEKNQEIPEIWVSKRKNKNKTLWFVLNTSNKEFEARIESDKELKELPLNDNVTKLNKKENGIYKRKIKSFESLLLQTVNKKDKFSRKEQLDIINLSVSRECNFNLKNNNLLRMYNWEMSLLNENSSGESHLVPAVPVINQLEEGNFSFTPHYKKYFGKEPELELPDLDINYEYTFINKFEGQVELVMEPDSIKGDWEIIINSNNEDNINNRIIKKCDFSETETHIRGSLGIDITELLNDGENIIKVRLKAYKANHGLQNPLYLAGDFGVDLNPVTLVPLDNKGIFEDYEKNLIPFYSGIIEYNTKFYLEKMPDTDNVLINLDIEKEFHQAAEISINGEDWQRILWEPRYFKYSTEFLTRGENDLKLKVYTTLIRSFEGMRFDYSDHEYKDIK